MKSRQISPIVIAALAIVLLLAAGCNRPDASVAIDTPVPANPQAQPTLPPAQPAVQPTLPPAVTAAPAEPNLDATMQAAASAPTVEATPAGVGEATAMPAAPAAAATSTPAPQPTVAPQPTAAATGPTVHTVQSGERLFSIARLYNVNPYAIAQLNGISAPYLIYPGQKLKIPGTGPSATPVPNQTPVPGSGKTYTVQAGDNLFRIALKFGVSMQAIAAANGLGNYNFIYIGQVLKIP